MTALLAESEGVGDEQDNQEQSDNLEDLFDDEYEDGEEEYRDGIEEEVQDTKTEDAVSDLFGDVDDIESEDKQTKEKEACQNRDMSKEDLQGLSCCSLSSELNSKHFHLMYDVIFSILRRAQAHAGTDAAVAATAGSKPEGFQLIFDASRSYRQLGWSQINIPEINQGQANRGHTKNQDTSR